jgi:hypothetical protein
LRKLGKESSLDEAAKATEDFFHAMERTAELVADLDEIGLERGAAWAAPLNGTEWECCRPALQPSCVQRRRHPPYDMRNHGGCADSRMRQAYAKIYVDGVLSLNLVPKAHCFRGNNYDHNEIMRRALDLVGIELEQTYYEGD